MKTTWHFLISGRVQGVGYRRFTQDQAQKLGLVGWVRNLSDGRVEAMATGEAGSLHEFCAILKKGPSLSRVDEVTSRELDSVRDFDGFSVTHEGDS